MLFFIYRGLMAKSNVCTFFRTTSSSPSRDPEINLLRSFFEVRMVIALKYFPMAGFVRPNSHNKALLLKFI